MSRDDEEPSPGILDPHHLAAIARARRRLEELRRERSSAAEARGALEREYEQARARLDDIVGGHERGRS
jgi:hypothetical protein